MKVRTGFVSNSSSSSFVCKSTITLEVANAIVGNLVTAYNLAHGEGTCDMGRDIDIHIGNKLDINRRLSWSSDMRDPKIAAKKAEQVRGKVTIRSVSDNSIPWAISEFIEDTMCDEPREHEG